MREEKGVYIATSNLSKDKKGSKIERKMLLEELIRYKRRGSREEAMHSGLKEDQMQKEQKKRVLGEKIWTWKK